MFCKRWLPLLLALALFTGAALPAGAAQPAGQPASLLIEAEHMDFPTLSLGVELYRRDEAGLFQPDDAVRFDCQINRVTRDAKLFIQPRADGTWATVDYLADMNKDGVYEFLVGEESPVCDSVDAQGALSPWADGGKQPLAPDEAPVLTAQALLDRGSAVLAARISSPIPLPDMPGGEELLYMISLYSPQDGGASPLCYYVKIYDRVILPSDVEEGSWYYEAAQFALERGFLSGTGEDAFSPGGPVTRAQLAQILWRLGGSRPAAGAGFPDVAAGDWYFSAVSWCAQEGLMPGLEDGRFAPNEPLTRELLAAVLRKFTLLSGLEAGAGAALDAFQDGAEVSPWAKAGVEWAVGAGLLAGSQGRLRPGSGITRAELAVVLRGYCLTILEADSQAG